jgi:Fur family ferric uptake transcriptional regulator
MMTKVKPDAAGAHRDRKRKLNHAQALAEAQLRAASVRITTARVKVLAALLGARCAFSHQNIQDTFVDMDRVTLYRALDCLIDAQLAHKIAGDDRIFRYSAGTEHSENNDVSAAGQQLPQHQHSHFKCTRCTKVFCLDSSGEAKVLADVAPDPAWPQSTLRQQLQNMLQETLGKGFQSHDVELTIKGWCADCAH